MGASRARVKFIVAWGLLLAAKLVVAATMPLFGDEAFYAWAGLHPAWAYSDLPGATAALTALGTALAGDSAFGVRLGFVLLAAALPWMVVRLARRLGDEADAWRAGLWSLPIPLLMPMGVMALPDALLTVAALAALDACAGLLRKDARAGALHLQLAFALALGALAHYRFAPLLLIGAVGFLACGGLRRWREPGLWAALAVGALAWWPVLDYNLGADAAGLRFQLVERHPWSFHAAGLAQPLLQAIITTPLLYGLFAWALWRAWRTMPSPLPRFLVLAGVGLWLFYALLAPFVDRARFSLHWPIPAYLVAATLLPAALRQSRGFANRLAPWAAGLAVAATVAMLALFAVPASPTLAARSAGSALYPDNFVGWREMAAALRPRLAEGDALVADHFMLAAQLSFELGRRREVFVLDHWNNHKHGRAAQIDAWGYGEAGIADLAPGTRAWIAFEVAETDDEDRAAWAGRLCQWFDGIEFIETVDGPGGGKQFWLYRGVRRASGPDASACRVALPQP
jgi:4-amino-4-deoxy-L-arabinose transferase-like glycosyltransferase